MRANPFLFILSALCSCTFAQDVASLESGFVNLKYGVAVLTDSKGVERTIRRDSASDAFTPVPISQGDTLELKDDADCNLVFPQVGTASLGTKAKVKISAETVNSPDPKKTSSIELLGGKLFLDIDGKGLAAQKKQFRVKTPTTILAVKGTQFFADAETEIETIGVHEGRVIVAEDVSGKFTTLNSGNAVAAKPGGLTKNRTLTAEEKKLSEIYDSFAVEFIPAEKDARKFTSEYKVVKDQNSPDFTHYPKLIKSEKSEELGGSAVKITIQPYTEGRPASIFAATRFETLVNLKSSPQFIHFMARSNNVNAFLLYGNLEANGKLYEVEHPRTYLFQFPAGTKPDTWVPFLIPMRLAGINSTPSTPTSKFSFILDPSRPGNITSSGIFYVFKDKPEYTLEISPIMIGVTPNN